MFETRPTIRGTKLTKLRCWKREILVIYGIEFNSKLLVFWLDELLPIPYSFGHILILVYWLRACICLHVRDTCAFNLQKHERAIIGKYDRGSPCAWNRCWRQVASVFRPSSGSSSASFAKVVARGASHRNERTTNKNQPQPPTNNPGTRLCLPVESYDDDDDDDDDIAINFQAICAPCFVSSLAFASCTVYLCSDTLPVVCQISLDRTSIEQTDNCPHPPVAIWRQKKNPNATSAECSASQRLSTSQRDNWPLFDSLSQSTFAVDSDTNTNIYRVDRKS